MGEKLLYLLRHGDTGMTGRYLGSSDLGLSERGVRQLEKTRLQLHDARIETVYCSPLLRCRQTLDLLELTCRHQFCDALREIDFGRWERKSFEEVVKTDKELVDSWNFAPDRFCFPGGESVPHFRKRVEQFKKQLEDTDDERVLVVSHGGVIRHLLCLALGLYAEKYLIFDVRPGNFCSIKLFGECGVLTGFNLGG
ncbi:MAG: histidine phosphatase family protein [Desulforhopalus sp.]